MALHPVKDKELLASSMGIRALDPELAEELSDKLMRFLLLEGFAAERTLVELVHLLLLVHPSLHTVLAELILAGSALCGRLEQHQTNLALHHRHLEGRQRGTFNIFECEVELVFVPNYFFRHFSDKKSSKIYRCSN